MNGLKYYLGSDSIEAGHDKIASMLKAKKLLFFNTCRNHCHFIDRYSWKDWKGKTGEDRSLSEKVSEKYTDFVRNIQYYALGYPKYEVPLPEPGKEIHVDAHLAGHRKILQRLGVRKTKTDIRSLV